MLNYAFANAANKLAYISDDTFAYRGTWSGTASYASPLDVVDYNNGKWIAIVSNTSSPPLGSASWSQLCLIGTINPTSPFEIATTALATANTALTLAQSAYALALQGTDAGTQIPIPNGTHMVSVSGLGLAYLPSNVVCTVQVPSSTAPLLQANPIGAPTTDGFLVILTGTTTQDGYYLNWIAHR